MALDYSIIGKRLKEARTNNKLTQEQLSEKINVSIAFLSRIERGYAHISLKRLSQICNILGISEALILNGSSTESNIYLDQEFSDLLKTCPPEKIKLIYDIAKIVANS